MQTSMYYIINAIFEYCLAKKTKKFTLKNVYKYKNIRNIDYNDIGLLRSMHKIFQWDNFGHFYVFIKTDCCRMYNYRVSSCRLFFCDHIHICQDIITNSKCERDYTCELEHDFSSKKHNQLLQSLGFNVELLDRKLFLAICQVSCNLKA